MEVWLQECEWKKAQNFSETVERFCNHYWRYMEITNDVKVIISKFVAERLDDHRIFTEDFETRLGLMTWRV